MKTTHPDIASLRKSYERAELDDEPALRLKLGAAAHATILGAHTWQHVVQRILGAAGLFPFVTPCP